MTRFAALLLGCSACWGEGPVPDLPEDVKVLYSVPPVVVVNACDQSSMSYKPYIADVAFGNSYIHVGLSTWRPPTNGGCDSMNGGQPPSLPASIVLVPIDGVGQIIEKSADTLKPGASAHIAVTRDGVEPQVSAWAWNGDDGKGIQIHVESNAQMLLTAVNTSGSLGGVPQVTGFVAGAGAGYLTVTTISGSGQDFFGPSYPFIGQTNDQTISGSEAWRIPWATPTQSASLSLGGDTVYSTTLKSGLISSPAKLFYAARGALTDPTVIKSIDKADIDVGPLMPKTLVTVARQDVSLVGMDASSAFLVYALSPSYALDYPSGPSCVIRKYDVLMETETEILNTSEYSCLDVAFDGEHVYFTIIEPPDSDYNDGTPGAYGLYGVGLGRVHIDGGEPETVRHGIHTLFQGPRRVYVYGEDLYAVDSFAVVRIPKSAFVNKHDF